MTENAPRSAESAAPFWPETEPQRRVVQQVANAALAEVGMGDIARIVVLADGVAYLRIADHDAFREFRSAEHYVDQAVSLGWQAASHSDGSGGAIDNTLTTGGNQ